MAFVIVLTKIYIVILMFRFVATKQELIFNPLGRILVKATSPVLPQKNSNSFILLWVAGLVVVTSLISSISTSTPEFLLSLKKNFVSYIYFFMLFYIVSMIFGSFGNRPIGGGFIALFFRLGLPWVKLARIFIPINSGKIIIPAIIILYILTTCFTIVINAVFNIILYQDLGNMVKITISSLASGAYEVFGLLIYMSFIFAFRALISWVSPDPRNIIVQLIYIITEPILEPLRKLIPPIGIIDFSAFIAVIGFYFIGMVLQQVISPLM